MRTVRSTSVLLAAVAAVAAVAASEIDDRFQWRQPYPTAKGESYALLWIPPTAAQVRGVLVAGSIPVEKRMIADPAVRAACARQGIAILGCNTGLGGVDLGTVLGDLAARTGYGELKVAPLAFFGHSAGGPQARDAAAAAGARCFALAQHRGGLPPGAVPLAPGVPTLAMGGQFDEFGGRMRIETGEEPAWQNARAAMLAWRGEDPATHLGGFVVEPGAGHFAWSARNAALFALFIEKAAAARIPATWPVDAAAPPALTRLDPAAGWLVDLAYESGETRVARPAADAADAAAAGRCGWYVDQAMAEAVVAYLRGLTGRKDQFIGWRDKVHIDAGARLFFASIAWNEDGSFTTQPHFLDAYPAVPNGPRWHQAGQPCGHGSAPILVRGIGGPIEAAGPDRLRFRYSAIAPADEPHRPTFLAYSVGDAEYRYTELVGMCPKNFKGVSDGRAQAIVFAELPPLPVGAAPVTLAATSDAGLPVQFHVLYGPAVIDGATLRLDALPPRATLPIEVAVAACQIGRGVEPRIRAAEAVVRRFQVVAQP